MENLGYNAWVSSAKTERFTTYGTEIGAENRPFLSSYKRSLCYQGLPAAPEPEDRAAALLKLSRLLISIIFDVVVLGLNGKERKHDP